MWVLSAHGVWATDGRLGEARGEARVWGIRVSRVGVMAHGRRQVGRVW